MFDFDMIEPSGIVVEIKSLKLLMNSGINLE